MYAQKTKVSINELRELALCCIHQLSRIEESEAEFITEKIEYANTDLLIDMALPALLLYDL